MWLKKAVGVTLVIALSGIFGLSFGAIAFTKAPTVTMINPDGSTKQVTPDEAAVNPNLVEHSTSSDGESDTTQNQTADPPAPSNDTTAPDKTNPPEATTPNSGSDSSSPASNPTPSPSPAPTTPKPVVSLSIAPSVITSGGSSTLQWSASNGPTSCMASSSWSGAKSSSGSQSTGAKTTGSYTYTLTCSNAGGSGSTSVTQTVNAPPINYCGGLSPCYGMSQMAQHASQSTCWGYSTYRTGGSYPRTYDLIKAYNGTSKHRQAGVSFWAKCGNDITNCINGQTTCGTKVRNHSASDLLNYSSPNGYYDPRKP